MSREKEFESSIIQCLSKSIHDIHEYELKLKGSTKFGEGFVCDVRYVTLNNKKIEDEKIHLIIKCLKRREKSKSNPTIPLFNKEVFIYTKFYPECRLLEQERCSNSLFAGLAKCYGYSVQEGQEIIIFENLKPKGYDIRPKGKPYSIEETKLIVSEMAKWHGFSFALKDQKPETFKKLTEDKVNIFGTLCDQTNLYNLFYTSYLKSLAVLEGKIANTALDVYRGLRIRFHDLMNCKADDETEYAVMSHGDSWSNNFLFKYEDNHVDGRRPSHVCIIDWQCSSVALPVFDISHFLYTTATKQQFNDMRNILDTYYGTLSTFIKHLGSDPAKLYPREKFQQHWNEYSGHGLLLTSLFLDYLLSEDADKEPEDNNEKPFEEMFHQFFPSDEEKYISRLMEFVNHFSSFKY